MKNKNKDEQRAAKAKSEKKTLEQTRGCTKMTHIKFRLVWPILAPMRSEPFPHSRQLVIEHRFERVVEYTGQAVFLHVGLHLWSEAVI